MPKPKKTKTVKSKADPDAFKRRFEFMKTTGIHFYVLLSNYTSEIVCPAAPELNFQVVSEVRSPAAFIAYRKILKDLNEWTANERPDVQRSQVEYFDFDPDALKHIETDGRFSNLHNIDLKSAYLHIIYMNYFISQETYEYCMKLSKPDRLVSVGMLASRKDRYMYNGDELTGMDYITKETESYFYYCVQETYKIIQEIKMLINMNFVFSWVDSVYFFDPDGTIREKIENYLKKIKFAYSYKLLTNVRVTEKKDFFSIKYGNNDEKNYFAIPKQQRGFKYDLLKAMNLI